MVMSSWLTFERADMEKKTNTIFNRLDTAKHFKPLSIYSRMNYEQKTNLQQRKSSNPFINFKIEVVQNCEKRNVEDSSTDDCYETPAKKAYTPSDLSPDLGYFSPPSRQDSLSSFAISQPAFLNETEDIKESVSSQPQSENEPGVNDGAVPHRCEKVLLNAPSFDLVDDIVCLHPLENVENCHTLKGKPVLNPTVAQGQSEPCCHKQAVQSGQPGVFTARDLEGDVEEAWNIGSPILESSMFQATPGGEESTLDTSYDTSLPLQVQVKSVVVVANQRSSTETAAPTLRKQTPKPRSQRPGLYDREVDWEREKRLYVHSVTRHMKEHPGTNKDVMSELMNLMTHVADQKPGADGTQWQHPSDLTCRNYRRRFGNETPKMTLLEWKSKNLPTHKRFAKVPKIFERSAFP